MKTLGYSRPARLVTMEAAALGELIARHLKLNTDQNPVDGFGQRIDFDFVESVTVDRNGKVQIVMSAGYNSADSACHAESDADGD